MKRILLGSLGLMIVYGLLAALNLSAQMAGCSGQPFCVLPSNIAHPWLPWLSVSTVGEFCDAWLVIGLLVIPIGVPLLVTSGIFQARPGEPGGMTKAITTSIPFTAIGLLLYNILRAIGASASPYGPHPIIRWLSNGTVHEVAYFGIGSEGVFLILTISWVLIHQIYEGWTTLLRRHRDR